MYVQYVRHNWDTKQHVMESRGSLGGTCLNVGCIPSKSLLHSRKRCFIKLIKRFDKIGITTTGLSSDVSKMMSHKLKTVDGSTRTSRVFSLKKTKDCIHGSTVVLHQIIQEICKRASDGSDSSSNR